MYHLKIDSIFAFDSAIKKKYILLLGVKDITPEDLQFLEFSSYVERR